MNLKDPLLIPKGLGLLFIFGAPLLAIKTIFGAFLAFITGWIFLIGAIKVSNELKDKEKGRETKTTHTDFGGCA